MLWKLLGASSSSKVWTSPDAILFKMLPAGVHFEVGWGGMLGQNRIWTSLGSQVAMQIAEGEFQSIICLMGFTAASLAKTNTRRSKEGPAAE